MEFCEDCQFWSPWIVDIPEAGGEVVVEGMGFCAKSSHWQKVAYPVRDDEMQCGSEGKWFEKRNPTP